MASETTIDMDALKDKEVGTFKTSAKSGETGVMDIGNAKATHFIVDLNDGEEGLHALTMLGKNNAKNDALNDILKMGQDGKGFQSKQLGLIDNETGDVDVELVELIKAAADESITSIQLVDAGSGSVTIAIEGAKTSKGGDYDVVTFEGAQLNGVLAKLSDLPAICELLPTGSDLKNGNSQIAVHNFDDKKSFFTGSDANVDSQAVKGILSGSSMQVDEAIELTQYALSTEGQADANVSVDFNGAGVIVAVDGGKDSTDTFIFKGDTFFDGLSTTTNASGKPLSDIKNKNSQVAVQDFGESGNFFVGSGSGADSDAFDDIVGGSSMNEAEAAELVALAVSGTDPFIDYLGGDDDSAIVAVDGGQDSTDVYLIQANTETFDTL